MVVAVVASASVAAPSGAAAPADPSSKVDSELLSQLSDGSGEFLVLLRDRADLSGAAAFADHGARVTDVYRKLTATADRSQAGIRALLDKRKVRYTPFWAVNAIKVTGDRALVTELAARPEVKEIGVNEYVKVPTPLPASAEPSVNGVEWNLDRIGAPRVWSEYDQRGEGIVVANIDTGVDFTHPTLVRQYRGNRGDGTFDHSYNWFDPSGICGTSPCDNHGHGSHTMGTMVGDDGAGNQIGVAPGAKWIAAKGCGTSDCTSADLLAAGQWMLAPTDSNGRNPRPDLAPHVVNNSWGGSGADIFYQQVVQAWVAAGIFPAFAGGNSGPSCGSANYPGNDPEAYAVGAYDSSNVIASFSSRGPSPHGVGKPNVAAPGVSVRSALPDGGYEAWSGTSMATPHVAGVVALLWAAAPQLDRDVVRTREVLDRTAVDVNDTKCGGTAANNNVWGEGRLDAFAAVTAGREMPDPGVGDLAGTITYAWDGTPVAGATVTLRGGQAQRTTTTDAAGRFTFAGLPAVAYQLIATHPRYVTGAALVKLTRDQTTVKDIGLEPIGGVLTGIVRDGQGNGLGAAQVAVRRYDAATAQWVNFTTVHTDENGRYRVEAAAGRYELVASDRAWGPSGTTDHFWYRCYGGKATEVLLDWDKTVDFSPGLSPDRSGWNGGWWEGYTCDAAPSTWRSTTGGTELTYLRGKDNVTAGADLGFQFPSYDLRPIDSRAYVHTNGYLSFTQPTDLAKLPDPATNAVPWDSVLPFAADLVVDAQASVWVARSGTAPNREFVAEWRNISFKDAPALRVTFQVVLQENGDILMNYRDIGTDLRERGDGVFTGLASNNGWSTMVYSTRLPGSTAPNTRIRDGLTIKFTHPANR